MRHPIAGLLAIVLVADGGRPAGGAADGTLARAFAATAAAHRVPRDLMVAVAVVEGGLAVPLARRVAPDPLVPAAGPLQLRHGRFDSLAGGARLAGTTERALREDGLLALDAGARVLAGLGNRTGARRSRLASWAVALGEMSGYADAAQRRDYVSRVYAALARGGTFPAADGEPITLRPHALPAATRRAATIVPAALPEYPGALTFAVDCASKCQTGRGGNAVGFVVLSDTEAGFDASVATLQNDPGKSVHYIVADDGRVGQFVPEADTAFHAGNFFYNQRAVGVTHVGFSVTGGYTAAEYAASGQLVTYLLQKYGLAADRAHVLGQEQIPNGNVRPENDPPCSAAPTACDHDASYGGAANHPHPGTHWEWCTYMPRVGGTCRCNDAPALLTCSADGMQAFRCSAGQVETRTCDGAGGCEPGPDGSDAVCHVTTTTTTTLPPSCPGATPVERALCGVDTSRGTPACGSETVDDALAALYDDRLAQSAALLAKADGAGKPGKRRRLLGAAARVLTPVVRKATKAAHRHRISDACAAQIGMRIADLKAAIGAAKP